MTERPHPQQPIFRDKDNYLRYRGNGIVTYLLKEGPFTLAHLMHEVIANKQSSEDLLQLQQLIGSRVDGPAKATRAKRHPIQPIVWDGNVVRFKKNHLVCYLLDNGPIDLNFICRRVRCGNAREFKEADYEQLMQLIGYSVSGAADVPEVSNRVLKIARLQVEALIAARDNAAS